jgi:hypothetical protein
MSIINEVILLRGDALLPQLLEISLRVVLINSWSTLILLSTLLFSQLFAWLVVVAT